MIMFAEDVPETALADVANLPGVMQVEAMQFHAATLRNGPREKRISIEVRPDGAELSRVIGASGQPIDPPPGGILLSDRLAEQLEIGYLDRLFRRSPQISVANVLVDEAQLPALHAALQETPMLSGLIEMNENRASFEDTISENVVVVNTVYAAIAILITVGVAYNGARIQMSERARELASLRILGFTRGEVSQVLVGETMLLALIAQPVGWLLGAWIAHALTTSFTSDLYAIPLVLEPASFAWASLVVLSASFASVMIVRRRIDRMDLVAVMKTRE
jgi:putative ABC transport system permease protein